MKAPVLDTSALMDILLADRPRHPEGLRLLTYLRATDTVPRIPIFAMFEIASALNQEKRAGRSEISKAIEGETNGLSIENVPIDEAFFTKYFDSKLPHLRAGDMIFLALAKGDGSPLVTEDRELLAAAKQAGVEAFTITDFLQAVGY